MPRSGGERANSIGVIMGFGDILGQLMQQGLGGAQPAGRLNQGLQNAGGGLDSIFAQLQGALGGGAGGAGGALGGFAEKARDFLGKDQVGGLSGGQIGGIGAIAGALLGGGAGGAARGGAMAVLGTLALSALKSAQARAAQAASPQSIDPIEAAPEEVASLTTPAAEKLMIAAMISAAKADGNIDEAEMQKVIGKISADSVTDEEKQFVMSEMQAPIDIAGLAAQAATPAQAAAVYTASLLTINVDTDQEKAYLAELARALKLDPATVSLLHQTTGVAA